MVVTSETALSLRATRETLGLSSRRVAQEIGVSTVTLSRWETGINEPRPEHLAKLRRIYESHGLQETLPIIVVPARLVRSLKDISGKTDAELLGLKREVESLLEPINTELERRAKWRTLADKPYLEVVRTLDPGELSEMQKYLQREQTT